MRVRPSELVHRHFDSLLENLQGAFDGDVEHVHQARVATRRLREILPLVEGGQHAVAVIRSAGRQLGTVRELDVMSSMLDSLGSRIPTAAAADLHRTTQAVRSRRREARRQMVKKLERLDLPALRDDAAKTLTGSGVWWRRARPQRSKETDSATLIWKRIAERSREAAGRAERTRAVYMPNRAHNARVAIKKLRYALEVAGDTGLWRADAALKDLRRLQDALGDVHDLQVLDDTIADLTPAGEPTAAGPSPIRAIVQDDLAGRYADYIRKRDRVFKIADSCAHAASRHGRWRIPTPLLAASVFTAPIIVESIRLVRANPAGDLPLALQRPGQ